MSIHVQRHAELDSTNNRAAQLAADPGTPLPALVVAQRQTAGRGRGGNVWWSSEGALTFSLLLDAEDLPPARWALVSLATAIAVADVLESYLPDAAQLKWPNDVFVGGRKICGILVEAPPVRPARLIVGIGLNVNNSLHDAPEEIRARATSCVDICGAALDREQVLEALTAGVLSNISALRKSFELVRLWSPRCLLTGRSVVIDTPSGEITGDCGGIDSDGALLVQSDRGVERLFAGVVKSW